MKSFKNFTLNEAKGKSLIICDVQPHDVGRFITFDMYKFADFVNEYDSILVLYNGADLGWESEDEMYEYYSEIGIDVDKCEFYEKYYAFFRSMMDYGYDESEILDVLAFMKKNRIYNSEDIDEKNKEKLGIEEFNDSIYIPDELADKLKKWSGSDLCGGGKNECLAEIEILMKHIKSRYKMKSKWVY